MNNNKSVKLKMEIVESNRKTMSMRLLDDLVLQVRVPFNTPKKVIDEVVNKHHNWIQKRVNKINLRQKQRKKNVVLWLGKLYPIVFSDEYNIPTIRDLTLIINKKYENDYILHLEKWYKENALKIFNERAYMYAKLLGVSYSKIKLSNARTRWGSCSSKGNINLSWRLIMASLEISDYVIIHELAHRLEMNHSANFWKHVESVLPNYKNARKWLTDNGYMLNL